MLDDIIYIESSWIPWNSCVHLTCSLLTALLHTWSWFHVHQIEADFLTLSHQYKATEPLNLFFLKLSCTSNQLSDILASQEDSASTWLWYWQPPSNWSATTRNFQGRKNAGQSCYNWCSFCHFRDNCELHISIITSTVIPFKICSCN